MTRLICLIGSVVFSQLSLSVASALPATMNEVARELEKRGATQLDKALLSGTPVVRGALGEQSFVATMRQCDMSDYSCVVVLIRTCKSVPELGFEDAVRIANDYNTQVEPRGYSVVTGAASPSLCVQARYNLDGQNSFDMGETFDWLRATEVFADYVDERVRKTLSTSIIQ